MLNLTSTLHVEESTQRGDLTNQLSLNYRGSPLAQQDTALEFDGLKPGDRMPDRNLPDGRRLLQVLRSGSAVQVVMANGARILLRPDGYIAAIGHQPVSSYQGYDVLEVPAF